MSSVHMKPKEAFFSADDGFDKQKDPDRDQSSLQGRRAGQ